MPRTLRMAAWAAAVALAPAAAQAQFGVVNPPAGPQGTFAITNAHIVPVSGPDIARGTLVISGGKITALGADVTVPSNATVIDATGLSVYPGMMDGGSMLGLSEIGQGAASTVDNAEVGNFNPNAQAYYGINPQSAIIAITRVVGITEVISRPTGGVISGQAAILRLEGSTTPQMTMVQDAAMVITLPGSSSGRRGFGGFGRGGGNAAALEKQQMDSLEALIANARAYRKAWDAYDHDKTLPRPDHDVVLESMQATVDGKEPVMFVADREADIRRSVEFAERHQLRPVILGGRESYQMTDYLKEHHVPVILAGVRELPENEDEPYDVNFSTPGKLAAAGVQFAISSGESPPDMRDLPYVAGEAAGFGLSREDALKSVTLWPAQIFGIADQVGSLAVGKVANVVVTTGDMLEPRTDTKYLFIDGRPVPLETKHLDLYEAFKDRK
ncbi:MAG: amidohydrolase family protein [Gemmatimonadota bacterium]|nr:amidohydrolase family protein [Gemmatimonadota bacterium]